MTDRDKAGVRALAGKCFCGAVRYAVPDQFLYAMNCHCSNCRRTTGSAFKPFAGIERGKLRVTQGGDRLLVCGDDKANDTHCRACGSLLYSVVRDGAFVHVAMGTLVDDPSHPPDTAHLRRLEGALVHHHRRPAAVRRACQGGQACGRRLTGPPFGVRIACPVGEPGREITCTIHDRFAVAAC